jgi:putative hydrolase of the HAD superfamily
MWDAIVFDGDDTLWETEQLYDQARHGARGVVEAAGLDGAQWEALERELDVANVARFGHDPIRFPTSCVEAYEALCAATNREPDGIVAEQVRDQAQTVFERLAPLLPHAAEVLERARARGVKLALLTKGDAAVQRGRIAQSGLADLFDVIAIVADKTPETIALVLAELGTAPSRTLSVGNSVRSDVIPALAAGLQPVWIDAHVWEYERRHDDIGDANVIELPHLGRLLDAALL